MKNRIAFTGKAGSGKSTLADYLKKEFNYKPMHFATPVKEIAYTYFDMAEKNRSLLQAVAGGMREIDPNVWVKCIKRSLDSSPHFKFVIDDCRYLNEVEMLMEEEFVIIKLVGRQWEMTEEQMNHQSETELEDIAGDYVLDTSKSIEETKKELRKIIFSKEKNK